MLYGYRVVNIFLNATHVRSRVNLVHFKGVQLEPYQTYMMKLTCCRWDCLLEHGAHSRHITQIGIYFILRNNSYIDVPWNISKIPYWTSFFLLNTWFDIELCDILCSILCKLYIMRIGVLYWHILWKGLIWNYKYCWAQPWLPFGILLDVLQKWCPIVFRRYPTNFKITWTEKSMIWIQC